MSNYTLRFINLDHRQPGSIVLYVFIGNQQTRIRVRIRIRIKIRIRSRMRSGAE